MTASVGTLQGSAGRIVIDVHRLATLVAVTVGVDAVAVRIREAAREAGIPIHEDPPTARSLYASVDIGQQIAPDLYRPVAAAIRFAEDMRQKAKRGVWR